MSQIWAQNVSFYPPHFLMGKVIGIDLGTTYSCVAFVDDDGEAVVIPNAEGSRTTPSVVALAPERRIGTIAKRQAVTNPEGTIFAVKRLMGCKFASIEAQRHASSVPYKVVEAANGDAWVRTDGKEYSPSEISSMVLRTMKETAESYLGTEIREAVVTVPAYFDDAQRQATKDAGTIAGLDVKRIINEPTAAALACKLTVEQGKRVAVYDLGGGTFDVSILEISDGVFCVKSTAGDTHLGGEDFDNALVEHLAAKFQKETGIDLRKDRAAFQRLKEQAEKAKHELSSSLETEINLPFIAADSKGPKHLVETLKRSDLEILVAGLVRRTLEPCKQALADASLTPADIDEVLLVGGQTRMPLVQREVAELFGKKPNRSVNPDEVVAVGAALHAAALSGQREDVLLLDVTPLSLGVETGGGLFHRLIPRNTTIPTRKAEVFTTSVDNQPFVPIHVLQGEREMAADNRSLVKFELAPILPAPRGTPEIEVMFDIDANGIVSVNAKDLRTGKAQSTRIVASSGLSKEQIERIIREADESKESDSKRKELAELKNTAEALLYTSERAVQECAELVDQGILDAVRGDIEQLRALIQEGVDANAIRDGLQRLEVSAHRIAESIYGAT